MTAPGFAQSDLLLVTLEVAVPLRIAELERMTPDRRLLTLNAWRIDAIDAVAYRGDILQFKGGKKGETAAAFNDLARGLAVLAHAPGGVLFNGRHWCLEHPWGKQAASIAELTCEGRTFPEAEPQPAPVPARKVETVTAGGVL